MDKERQVLRNGIVDNMADTFNINPPRGQVSSDNVLKIQILDLIHDTLALPRSDIPMNLSNLESLGCQIAVQLVCPRLGINENHSQIRLQELTDLINLGILVSSLG